MGVSVIQCLDLTLPNWTVKLSLLQNSLTQRKTAHPVTTVQTLSLLLLAAYFVFLAASLRRRGRVIAGPWLFLFRSFFPNWRFYHGFGAQPRLFTRTATGDGHWGGWTMFMPRAPFKLANLVHNPRNNLLLANQNLVDHLSFDVQTLADGRDVRELVTYQMADRLARELIAAQGEPCAQYQFQLRLVPPLQVPTEDMAILTSPMLPAPASPAPAPASAPASGAA